MNLKTAIQAAALCVGAFGITAAIMGAALPEHRNAVIGETNDIGPQVEPASVYHALTAEQVERARAVGMTETQIAGMNRRHTQWLKRPDWHDIKLHRDEDYDDHGNLLPVAATAPRALPVVDRLLDSTHYTGNGYLEHPAPTFYHVCSTPGEVHAWLYDHVRAPSCYTLDDTKEGFTTIKREASPGFDMIELEDHRVVYIADAWRHRPL